MSEKVKVQRRGPFFQTSGAPGSRLHAVTNDVAIQQIMKRGRRKERWRRRRSRRRRSRRRSASPGPTDVSQESERRVWTGVA